MAAPDNLLHHHRWQYLLTRIFTIFRTNLVNDSLNHSFGIFIDVANIFVCLLLCHWHLFWRYPASRRIFTLKNITIFFVFGIRNICDFFHSNPNENKLYLVFFSNSYSYYNISPKVEHNMRVRVWYIWFNFKHFYFQFIFYMFRLPMLANCILVHVCAVSLARIKLKQNNGSTT